MSSKQRTVGVTLCLVVLGLLVAVPVFAGSGVVGSVSGSMNATVGGQVILPNATLFSGDSLQVKDGLAVVTLGSSSRMVFGRNTVASFLRDSNEVTVLLDQGSVSVFHDANGAPVRMKIGSLSVVPVSGIKTLGEVAVLNGSVVVSAKDGMLRVEGTGNDVNVPKGKTITLVAKTNAPQSGGNPPGAGRTGGSSWQIVGTSLTGLLLILEAVDLSKISNASNNSSSAASAAAADASAAQAALSAINALGTINATELNDLGCTLDTIENQHGIASTWQPTAPCPSGT